MWKNLTPADLEQAKRQLQQRRQEMLSRQAEERQGLEAEHAGVETLDRMADNFVQKFMAVMKSPSEPVKPRPPEAAVVVKKEPQDAAAPVDQNAGKPPPRPRHSPKRTYAESNFETFSRAVSRLI